jgi:hypothetical protein
MFIQKVIGHMGNHAKDVIKKIKCLLEKKKYLAIQDQGKVVMEVMSKMERLRMIAKGVQQAMDTAKGGWEAMSKEEQGDSIKIVYATLVIQAGQCEWDQMTQEQQDDALFFVSLGCCCHKDLNVVKWAVKRMDAVYAKLDLPAPILSRPSCNGYVGDPVSRKEVRREAGIRDRNPVSVIWNSYGR